MTNRGVIDSCLKVIGLAGLAGITVMAPNAAQGLSIILKKSGTKTDSYARLMVELKRRGLIHVINSGESYTYTLTPAGIHRLQQAVVDELEIPSPKKWDKKWRLVSFDIPSGQSAKRAKFTMQLKRRGFMMLQKSVWAYPFPCFRQVEQMASHYNVLRYCSLMEIEKVDELSARRLLRHFQAILT